jgi:hypothetical protein
MADRIQLRRDTAANWTSTNPILASGEMGYETDTQAFKLGDGVTAWASLPYIINTRTITNAQVGTTYTPVITDENKLVTLSNAAAITCTIPPNGSVAFQVGASIEFAQLGAGQVTFAAGVGVTLQSSPGLKMRAQYSGAMARKLATNTWLIIGDLAA